MLIGMVVFITSGVVVVVVVLMVVMVLVVMVVVALIPRLERSTGEEIGYPLQYS